ncbi:MAG: peptidylprolyl isomerase [bacterium]|nr:peptidylprolyl isomerase [bacterium]
MSKKIILILSIVFIGIFACKSKKTSVPAEPKEEIVKLSTQFGDMYIWLYKATPLHRENFLKLAKAGFYDSTTFHRIISGFMIQGGDPNSKDKDPYNDGMGGPGYTIPAEIRDTIIHDRGALAAARTNNPEKASSGSQFYICHSKGGTSFLNRQYTVFGMVMKGMNVIDSIAEQPKEQGDRPINDIRMKVTVEQRTLKQIQTEFNYIPKQ